MKTCSKCGEAKSLDDFRFRKDRQKHENTCKACERAYQRELYAKNPEAKRAKAAKSMRELRADPKRRGPHLEKRRSYYHKKGKHSEKAYYERMKRDEPWRWKVRNLRRNINPKITEEWLRMVWEDQNGRCSLSGRELDIRTAELDHIVPRSKNGSDDLENLRLVCPEANAAKGSLTDRELHLLCADILKNQIPELLGNAYLESIGWGGAS